MRSLALGVAAAAVSVALAAAQEAPRGDRNAGEALYMKLGCYACHGAWGQGNGRDGPRLTPPMPYAAFLQQIRTPRLEMPAYVEASISDQGVADILAYLAGIPPGPDYRTIRALE